jgi:transposase-like protein
VIFRISENENLIESKGLTATPKRMIIENKGLIAKPANRVQGAVKRQYSDEEKALALVALDFNGGNLHRTARELTIPRKTLAAWAVGHNQCSDVAKKRQLHGDDLAERFEEIIWKALESITPEKMQAARLLDLSRSVGVFVDKMLLLRSCTCGAAKGRRGLRRMK